MRALVATLVVVALGASAHGMSGGSPLQPVSAAVLVVLVGPLVWFVLRARTSVPRMVLATATGQVVTHLALVGMAPSRGGAAMAHHVHDASAVVDVGSIQPLVLHATGPMVLSHVLATVLASLLLAVGEDVVRALVRYLVVVLLPAATPLTARIRPGEAPVRRLTGRSLRPVGTRSTAARLLSRPGSPDRPAT